MTSKVKTDGITINIRVENSSNCPIVVDSYDIYICIFEMYLHSKRVCCMTDKKMTDTVSFNFLIICK